MFSVSSSSVREKKFASTRLGSVLMQRKGDTVTDNNALFFAHRMREREELRKNRKLSGSSKQLKSEFPPRA
jgi:hypothetical protein